jgi:hypothetical protein
MADVGSNGRRVELEVTGEDMSAVLRIKMNQISELELQVIALTRMVADRDEQITSLNAVKEPVATEV